MLDLDAIEAQTAGALEDHEAWVFECLCAPNYTCDIKLTLDAVPALVAELRAAREVLVFADGLAVANTGFPLAALYAEDCEWAQQALKAAGCFPAAYRAV
jgi:hypothetical protein